MKYSEESRAFASFSGICPYKCLHCYTFSDDFISRGKNDIDEIISDLKNREFNIVYISGYKENFANAKDGIALIEEIHNTFHCDILLTTRAVFESNYVERLIKLNHSMRSNGNRLYFCVSVPAYQSYKLLEPNPIIPKPEKRLAFLRTLYKNGINTILTIRPLCPNNFIPIAEVLKIIDIVKNECSAVISSGIIVDDFILKNLKSFPEKYDYTEKRIMSCLDNDIKVKYVCVDNELEQIKKRCTKYGVPFFKNSLPAINYICENMDR